MSAAPRGLRVPMAGPEALTFGSEGWCRIDGEAVRVDAVDFDWLRRADGERLPAMVCKLAQGRGKIAIAMDGERWTETILAELPELAGRDVLVGDSVTLDRTSAGVAWVRCALIVRNGASALRVDVELVVVPNSGTLVFDIDGGEARLRGTIGVRFPAQVDALLTLHPGVHTLRIDSIPGGASGPRELDAMRRLRAAGMRTVVSADGLAASAGVCLFLAGVERLIEPGGRIGVHAWAKEGVVDGVMQSIDGQEVALSDPGHDAFRAFFVEHLQDGAEFYDFAITAAPSWGKHWLSDAEVDRFGLVENGASQSR